MKMQISDHVLRVSRASLPPETLEGFVNRYVWIREGSRIVDLNAPPQIAVMGKEDFVNMVARASMERVGARGASTRIPMSKLWIDSSDRVTVTDTRYEPAIEDALFTADGATYYNTFSFPQHEEVDDPQMPPAAMAHLEYIFGDDVGQALDYFAHIIQRPYERPSWVPLNVARHHGTGRGWIDQMMIRVLGDWNCSTTKIKPLVDASGGGFSNFYDDKLWCNVPEIRVEAGARFEVDDKLRDALTDKHMLLNPKYGKQAFKMIFTRTFLCSNHLDGLLIPQEDRRIWATMVAGPPKPEHAYDHLYHHLKDKRFVAQIFHALKNRDISEFNAGGRAPMTPTKRQIILLTQSEPESAFSTIGDRVPGLDPEILTTDQVLDFTNMHDSDAKRRMRAVLKARATLYLANDKDGRLKWRGQPHKVWILKDHEKWKGASRETVREELERVQKLWDDAENQDFDAVDDREFEDFI